jgi:segregation and condensation protein A
MDSRDNTDHEIDKEIESTIADNPLLQDLPRDFQNVLDHILFHKALISDEADGEQLNLYLELMNDLKYGTHVSITDPYDKSIAITFELAIDKHLNPWDIDLDIFAQEYIKRVKEHDDLDLVTAGRIIVMAWTILKIQSDIVLSNAENMDIEEEEMWSEPSGDWFTNDVDYNYTARIIQGRTPPIQEMVRRKGDRPVTLIELVGAFEEARKEAEILKVLNEQRRLQRERDRVLYKSHINDNMHKEDLEAEINLVYERICKFNGQPIPFSDLCESSDENKISTLISSLYLANRRQINIWQPDFPYGRIYILKLRNKKAGAPPLPGEPAEDSTFRGLRARARENIDKKELLAKKPDEQDDETDKKELEKLDKKVPYRKIISRKKIAS